MGIHTLMPTHMRQTFSPKELQGIQLAGPFSFTKGCRIMKLDVRPQEKGRINVDLRPNLPTLLFDLQTDPHQQTPFNDPAVEQRMIDHMIPLMQQADAPPEQYERLGLRLTD